MATEQDVLEAKVSQRISATIIADSEWWKKIESVLGCTLHSFNFRSSASFKTPGGIVFSVPGEVARHITNDEE